MNVFLKHMPVVALLSGSLLLTSCSISEKKEGKAEKVDINTPFGGMKVRTNEAAVQKDIGITSYPGAREIKSEDAHGDKNANVDITLPWFSLKVVAMKLESDDAPDKVLDFYRKDLGRYGKVLECNGKSSHNVSLGNEKKDDESHALTCDEDESESRHGVHVGSSSNGVELKVGTSSRFHVVTVESNGKGSKLGLAFIQTHDKSDSI